MKALSKCLQILIAGAFIYVLFLPLAANIHKGFIDKPGEWWYGYEIILISPMLFLITIAFPVAFFMAVVTVFISKPRLSWIMWSAAAWASSVPVCWLMLKDNRHDVMPAFHFFMWTLIVWPLPTVLRYYVTRSEPEPPRPLHTQ
jgi:hypothetical protein